MSIRAAVPGDLPALVQVEQECFQAAAWSESLIACELAGVPQTRYVAVAESGGEVEAYASLLVVGDCADVQRVAVRPRARRRGFGAALVTTVLDHAALCGCERTMLEVRADNADALALYSRLGFAEIHRRPGYYAPGVDALVMARPTP